MFRVLSQPYPRDNNLYRGFRTALISGFIVFLFLWIFRPFNINGAPVDNINLFILGYGGVTVLMVCVLLPLPLIFRNYFEEENWTVGKNIFYFLFIIFIIGIGNLLYTNVTTGLIIVPATFIAFELYTIAVGFIVAALFTLINYSLKLKKNEKEAKIIDKEIHAISKFNTEQNILITSENEKDNLTIPDRTLLYIESADNYSKVFYLKENKITMSMVRASLRKIDEQLDHPFILRCHRSYIVNLMNVKAVTGNSQGYRLHFHSIQETVPVARRSANELHERFDDLKNSISL